MSEYKIVNLLDLLDAVGEAQVRQLLTEFSCPKNLEIELFIRKNALDFSRRKMSITYLVTDDAMNVAAIFALTHKAVEISNEGLSSTARKKIQRYAQLDDSNNSYMVSAFLIAQFGKNYQQLSDLQGNQLMEYVFEVLEQVQRQVGGGVVYLECEDKEPLLKFYNNESNRFRVFDERYSLTDNTKYKQLVRFF